MSEEERQLSLLEGPRQKGERLPTLSEMAMHGLIADTLTVGLSPGWLWWHTPNGGWRTVAEAGKFKRMGVRAGVSDFLMIGPPDGKLHALEIKRRGEKPTEAQLVFMLKVDQAGGHAAWTDNFEVAMKILKAWGAVKVSLADQLGGGKT